MSCCLHAEKRGRQCRSDGSGIHPAVRMAPHSAVHRTVVHAGSAPNTAQHVLGRGAKEARTTVVQQDHMVFGRPIHVGWTLGPR